jgi:hypothetical protein
LDKIEINLSDTRRTVINWPSLLKQIVDSYRSFHTISHGVQKDAIQNSWDARKDKKIGKDWGVEFELIESSDIDLFIFQDYGTTGLTGKVLTNDELQLDLTPEERWGRFENVAFTKDPSEKALGARGRGKFIFLGASNHIGLTKDNKEIRNLIIYDTLRADGLYRMGFRTLVVTDSPIQAYEGNIAERQLAYFTKSRLSPIKHIGTRVAIVDPIEELKESFKNGSFKEHVEETWWEIIKYYNADIFFIEKGKKHKAQLLKYYTEIEDYANDVIWEKSNIKLPGAPNLTIRQLVIIYNEKDHLPEDIRGISIQRGGMKVCTIPVRYIEKSISDSIYGYVTLDERLEEKLREDEGPEHYSYDFKKTIPRLLKHFIEDELDAFLREKLGIGPETIKKPIEKSKSAEVKALYFINKIAADLGLIGKGMLIKRNIKDTEEKDIKPLRLKMGRYNFPNENMRVDYGQSIADIKLSIINDTDARRDLGVRFGIIYNDGTEICKFINNEKYDVKPHSNRVILKDALCEISKTVFKYKGKYAFWGRLVSLGKENMGEILHNISRYFWVEESPPQKGIFEDIEAIKFPNQKEALMGYSYRIESGGYIFAYNSSHPAKRKVEDDENNLMRYLIELMCMELAWIDLRRKESVIFANIDLEEPSNVVRGLSNFLGDIKFRINR